jgi:coenzyme F420-reducing hydrogenase alpha subunit
MEIPTEGVGLVEAPRGILIHHYATNKEGLLTKVNLIVTILFNASNTNSTQLTCWDSDKSNKSS